MCVWYFFLKMKKKKKIAQVASAGSSVGASPTGTGGVPEAPLSVKSAGASPPQSSGSKHLHINIGNQFRGGGSLPNVNNTITNRDTTNDTTTNSAAIHSIDLKVPSQSCHCKKCLLLLRRQKYSCR